MVKTKTLLPGQGFAAKFKHDPPVFWCFHPALPPVEIDLLARLKNSCKKGNTNGVP
jgi:hypothetical protein